MQGTQAAGPTVAPMPTVTHNAGQTGTPPGPHQSASGSHEAPGLEGYEKIRVVGKGAFGLAVLYRRLSDEQLVVIKEINMIELSASEREFALNEVQVLASLNHPNIISYHRSFEREGQLMIEMEYADGGNLAQLLLRRHSPFSERAILHIYRQICAALKHMHERGVLHRDLKTANVFLTRSYAVKVGDFGISKVLTTRAQAQTILGTPYYISPEMCEGKQYGPKSDIWASGCILYEMICLEKAFEATNLPALVNKIIKGEFSPVPEHYSPELGQLVHDILQRDPEVRPSAAQLCDERLPELIRHVEKSRGPHAAENSRLAIAPTFLSLDLSHGYGDQPHIRSILYWWRSHGALNFDLEPVPLPSKIQVLEVATGYGHSLLVTTDYLVYSWGDASRGQLGHGVIEMRRDYPACIEPLRGKSINKVCAGKGFSIFGSESGVLMSCGAGDRGCLGHGDTNDCVRPRIIERLLSVDIVSVACGNHHVAALGAKGQVFSWGDGELGKLGLGTDTNCLIPEEVALPPEISRERLTLRAGLNCTAVITATGDLIAWGSNVLNKLGLDRKGICGLFCEVQAVWRPSLVPLDFAVSEVSFGAHHSGLVSREGQLYVLGADPTQPKIDGPARIISVLGENVRMVTSGRDYTVAVTEDNVVYFWGVRYNSTNSTHSHHHEPTHQGEAGAESDREIVLGPQEILALYGAESTSTSMPSLGLGCVLSAPEKHAKGLMLLLLHTSAPAPAAPEQPHGPVTTVKSAVTQPLTHNTVPEWLKAELAAASNPNYQI